eukprot:TRINITY_DN286_c0_g1_i1.p1 TRINITY_DN286_c0_g1~~TRINITY_DN286_c0_g1_i1.p1  ORF type:complete len:1629 (+),score=391.49 TRINITY_DN286_c0_g1_i1:371-4888(+)
MTASKDVIADLQGAASSVIVAIGKRLPAQLLEEMIRRFDGVPVPHYFVIKSLADFAVRNPADITKRLKEILSRMLPLLNSIKHDNLRWVFAYALHKFAEAIREAAAAGACEMTAFADDINVAFEVLLKDWLARSEDKLRAVAVGAVGAAAPVMRPERFEAALPRCLPAVLALSRREKSPMFAIQALNAILETAAASCPQAFDLPPQQPLLPNVLKELHAATAAVPALDNAAGMRIYTEWLRCWESVARANPASVLQFVLNHIEQPQGRLGTLYVLRHLVSRLDKQFEDRKALVLSGLRPAMGDPSMKVREALCQLAPVLARQGYLSLEGGQDVISVVVACAAISDADIAKAAAGGKEGKRDDTPAELRALGERTLDVLTTTIAGMEDVLWPHLIKHITPIQVSGAQAAVAKAVTYLAKARKASAADDFIIDFDRMVNLPKPGVIIARLFVALCAPARRNVGIRIVEVMGALAEVLHPAIVEPWSAALPRLAQFLAQTERFTQKTWEDALLRVFAQTLVAVGDDEWTAGVATAFSEQSASYKGDFVLKAVLLRFFGVALHKCRQVDFVRRMVDHMFVNADCSNETERLGLAQGLGYAAAGHLDIVIERLKAGLTVEKPKSTGFFSFGSSAPADTPPHIKAAVMLSFGYVAFRADKKLITSRLDTNIMNSLLPATATAKNDVNVKECMIEAVDLIGQTVHPNHLEQQFVFKHRDELLQKIVSYVCPAVPADKPPTRVRALAACTTLIALPPTVAWTIAEKAVEATAKFLELPLSGESPIDEVVNEFVDMLAGVLAADTSVDTVCKLLKLLDVQGMMAAELPRQRAVHVMLQVLQKFVILRTEQPAQSAESFNSLAPWLAAMVSRSTDSVAAARAAALDAVEILLQINSMLHPEATDHAALLSRIAGLKPLVKDDADEKVLFKLASELGNMLGVVVTSEQLQPVLQRLLQGLSDPDHYASAGACLVVNGLFRRRGGELQHSVISLVPELLTAASASREHTANGALHALRTLARHHTTAVMDALLAQTTPPAEHVAKSIQVLVTDAELGKPVLQHVLEEMVNAQLFDERPDPKKSGAILRTPAHAPNSATCALRDGIIKRGPEELVKSHFDAIVSCLLLRVGTSNDAGDGAPKHVFTTLQELARVCECTAMTEALNDETEKQLTNKEQYPQALTAIVNALCTERAQSIGAILEAVFPYLSRAYAGYRTASVAVVSEFISHSADDRDRLYRLINCLLARMGDDSVLCRTQAFAGLGNVAKAGPEEVGRYAASVLSALISGLDDKVEDVAVKAFESLFKIVEQVDEMSVAAVLVNLCMRLKPAYARKNNGIRAAAFDLFGALSRFGQGAVAHSFYDQMHVALLPIILHVNDEIAEVRAACKRALRKLAPMLNAPAIVELVQRRAFDDNVKLNYDEWLDQLAPLLVAAFRDRVNFYLMTSIEYYKSQWTIIRGNAANFSGRLLAALPPTERRNVNVDQACVALVTLLKEPTPLVRKQAAASLSLLHSYEGVC